MMAEPSDSVPAMDNTKATPLSPENATGTPIESENEGMDAVNVMEEPKKKPVLKKTVKSRDFQPKNGCQKCCGKIMAWFGNDAIYGSFVGPHPVSLMCLCQPCRKWISSDKYRPLCTASVVTKLMNFIMLGFVTSIATFFIIPWFTDNALIRQDTDLESFYPCKDKKVLGWSGNAGCVVHAGYFMVYRCFLPFAVVMLTNFFAMLDVTSTSEDPYRKRIHHGFWLYKYLYLLILFFVCFFAFGGSIDPFGYFEYTCTIIGNIAHAFFSLFEVTIILDILDMWVVSMNASPDGWGYFLYVLITCIILIVDLLLFFLINMYFAFELQFDVIDVMKKAAMYDKIHNSTSDLVNLPNSMMVKEAIANVTKKTADIKVDWPYTNCLDGSYKKGSVFGLKTDHTHATLISLMGILFLVLVLVMVLKKRFSKKYPLQGWLHVAVIILFGNFYLWSGLFSSPNVHSRPRCNMAMEFKRDVESLDADSIVKSISDGSHDIYFRYTGMLHGVMAIFTLLYYAFVHGPRSRVSPLSLAYRYFIAGGNYDRVPVVTEKAESSAEFNNAVEKLEVWDDEQNNVAQSWSLFYFQMLLGSLSLMMAMTNFTDPMQPTHYNSSKVAMGFKIGTGVGFICTYIFTLVCPCTRLYKAYVPPKRIRRIIKKKQITFDQIEGEGIEEVQLNEGEDPNDVIIELIEEDDDEVSLKDNESSTHHQPNQCGCLF